MHTLRHRQQPPRPHHPQDPIQPQLGRHLTRVATALRHRARKAPPTHSDAADPFAGLVFCRPDGRPLGPHLVLDRLHRLSDEADVPRVTVHDLRHLAATITITAGVPLTVASKTLRHSTLSTTANLYSHLTQQAAREAVDTIDRILTSAENLKGRPSRPAWLRPPRDHIHSLRETLHRLRNPAPPAFSPPRTSPGPGMRPHCDHHAPEHTKGRPLDHERTASDLRQHKSGRQDLNLRPLDPHRCPTPGAAT
ncbi:MULTISPECIES: tyrosine-type recombinase/integrase [unclassified Streptomyces]|uniref:tyrosine-type recombinase/integrase n=1 Tax=unclassified Streptomyces TaxID=2593676 RepID=UPI0036EF4C03